MCLRIRQSEDHPLELGDDQVIYRPFLLWRAFNQELAWGHADRLPEIEHGLHEECGRTHHQVHPPLHGSGRDLQFMSYLWELPLCDLQHRPDYLPVDLLRFMLAMREPHLPPGYQLGRVCRRRDDSIKHPLLEIVSLFMKDGHLHGLAKEVLDENDSIGLPDARGGGFLRLCIL